MTVQLNPAAEYCLTAMGLTEPEKGELRSCISQYTGLPGMIGTLCWAIYRIINAVKSLFGMSDWQFVQKTIELRAMAIAARAGLIENVPQDRMRQRINKNSLEFIKIYAGQILEICYEAHVNEVPVDAEFTRRLTPVSLETALRELRSIRDELHSLRLGLPQHRHRPASV